MRRTIAALFVLQGLVIGLYFFVEGWRPNQDAPLRYERLSGKNFAPELSLQRDEASIKLSAHQGKFVLVHFWATWCEPCREELPELLALSREFSDERLKLLAISEDRDWKSVQTYFDGQIPPEILWDASGEGEELYEVSTLPDTYLVDPKGRLILRFGGARDWSSPAAKRLLRDEFNRPE